jgi:hypothetical protein
MLVAGRIIMTSTWTKTSLPSRCMACSRQEQSSALWLIWIVESYLFSKMAMILEKLTSCQKLKTGSSSLLSIHKFNANCQYFTHRYSLGLISTTTQSLCLQNLPLILTQMLHLSTLCFKTCHR